MVNCEETVKDITNKQAMIVLKLAMKEKVQVQWIFIGEHSQINKENKENKYEQL